MNDFERHSPVDLKNEKGISEVVNKMSIANTNEHLREVMISREIFLHDLNTEKQAARKFSSLKSSATTQKSANPQQNTNPVNPQNPQNPRW